ncbi:Uncharacterised protein [Mycobacterium tuberculosis]|nr:Uncharacterised protein [Mycobacterium tuberculosis]
MARATSRPTTNCPATTRQGEIEGFFARSSRASSAVNGLNSASRSSATSESCRAIVFILNEARMTTQNFYKAIDYK